MLNRSRLQIFPLNQGHLQTRTHTATTGKKNCCCWKPWYGHCALGITTSHPVIQTINSKDKAFVLEWAITFKRGKQRTTQAFALVTLHIFHWHSFILLQFCIVSHTLQWLTTMQKEAIFLQTWHKKETKMYRSISGRLLVWPSSEEKNLGKRKPDGARTLIQLFYSSLALFHSLCISSGKN